MYLKMTFNSHCCGIAHTRMTLFWPTEARDDGVNHCTTCPLALTLLNFVCKVKLFWVAFNGRTIVLSCFHLISSSPSQFSLTSLKIYYSKLFLCLISLISSDYDVRLTFLFWGVLFILELPVVEYISFHRFFFPLKKLKFIFCLKLFRMTEKKLSPKIWAKTKHFLWKYVLNKSQGPFFQPSGHVLKWKWQYPIPNNVLGDCIWCHGIAICHLFLSHFLFKHADQTQLCSLDIWPPFQEAPTIGIC